MVGIRQRKGSLLLVLKTLAYKGKHTHTQPHSGGGVQHKRPHALLPHFLGLQLHATTGFQWRGSHLSPQVQRGTPVSVFSPPLLEGLGQLQINLVSEG